MRYRWLKIWKSSKCIGFRHFLKILRAISRQRKELFQFRNKRLKIWHWGYKNHLNSHFDPRPPYRVVCNKITQISKIDGFEYFDSPIKYFLSFFSPITCPWDEETTPKIFFQNYGLVMRSAVTYGTKIVTYGTVLANISNSIN